MIKAPSFFYLLFGYLLTLWLLLTLNFLLPRLLPGDPLSALLDPQSSDYVYDPKVRSALEDYYGLNEALEEQYIAYLQDIAAGDLGQSIRLKQPVSIILREHLPWTLLLTSTALVVASIIGLWGGTEAAWRRNSITDRALVAGSVFVSNIPVFFTGTLLLILFAVQLDWLPLFGGRTAFAEYNSRWDEVRDYAAHLCLPALTLILALLGSKFLLVRGSMIGVLNEDYMLVLRAKGFSSHRLKHRHALRNAILPFVHHLAAHASFAVTGALFIETVFQYPGMGRLILQSVSARDYPVLQGAFLIVSVLVLLCNLLADWLTMRLDPRLGTQT